MEKNADKMYIYAFRIAKDKIQILKTLVNEGEIY